MTSKLSRLSRTASLSLAGLGGLAASLALGAGCGGSKLVASDGGAGHTGGAGADGGADTVVACPTGTGTGMLTVTIAGLPTGVTPMVRVMGGALTSPLVLTPGTPAMLAAGGGYVFAWRRVKIAPVAPAVVGKAYYLSDQPFDGCIKAGETATVTLTYAQEPGSEKAWVTVSNAPTLGNEIAGFASADLVASAAKNPTVWKSKNFTGRGAAGAIDSYGNFWVPGGDRINQYDMLHLATSTDAAPAATFTQPSGAAAKFAAFDANGNLWVSRGAPAAENSVVRYDVSQLGATGTSAPTPTVTITSSSFTDPAGIAFDNSGDLWVADAQSDSVQMFTATHIAASYAGAADVILKAGNSGTPVAASFTNPNALAFDQAKNLWVGFQGVLAMFTQTQQATSATLINATAPAALNYGFGTGAFAFDESGGLWLAGPMSGKIQRLPKTELDKASPSVPTPTPDIIIDSSTMTNDPNALGDPESVVLDPSPTWPGLHDAF